MSLYQITLSYNTDLIGELEREGITCHIHFPGIDTVVRDYLALFALLEGINRASGRNLTASLEEFEKTYFGIEVGNLRRYFNRIFESELKPDSALLDFGCGGTWWKDTYWPKVKEVYGVEVNPEALRELKAKYADKRKYHLVFSATGLTEFPDGSFEQILSSSVIGYILPKQAEYHLKECWRLLRPGGKLILTRINAYRYPNLFAGPMFERQHGSFAYAYSKQKLFALISQSCPGHRVEKYRRIGFLLPCVSSRAIQRFFCYSFSELVDKFVNRLFPFLGIHHFVVLKKS